MTKSNSKVLPKWAKVTLKTILILFLLYVAFTLACFIAAVVETQHAKSIWSEWQTNYIEYLEKQYAADPNFCKVNEMDYITSDITESTYYSTKINQVKFLATHNSYKTGLTNASAFLYHYPIGYVMGHKYDYVFDTITEQLNVGIRSIELDPNYVKRDGKYTIECIHSNVLETNSTCTNFSLTLKEIKMWMDRNPNASPITVLLETKNPSKFKNEAFDMLEEMIFSTFEDKLITPSQMLNGYATFKEMRAADAYPTVNDLKGKIIFLLHEKKNLDNYMERDMSKSALCVALEIKTAYKNEEYKNKSFILIANEANGYFDQIKIAINEDNFMIRSRLDEYDVITESAYTKGLEANSNILSSDYTPHVSEHIYPYPIDDVWEEDYMAILYEKNKTITLRK